jgi:hypothetical protein
MTSTGTRVSSKKGSGFVVVAPGRRLAGMGGNDAAWGLRRVGWVSQLAQTHLAVGPISMRRSLF